MKNILQLSIGLFLIGNGALAQQWTGNNNPTDVIYRNGKVGIGTSPTEYDLQVLGFTEMGDHHDPSRYGLLQVARPGTTTDGRFHLAFVRGGNHVTGMGYTPNSNLFGIWVGSHDGNRPTPTLSLSEANEPANTIGSESEFAKIAGTTSTNAAQFRFLLKRHNLSSGGWTNMSARLQYTTDNVNQGYVEFNPKDGFSGVAFGSENGEIMRLTTDGKVGIGTANPGSFKLAVEGKIAARGVKVTLGGFADYVFEPTYKLRPLAHLEQYINQNKHLPGIPTAEEVKKEGGIELGEMNVKLLEKVEELSLYIIEMNKKLEEQQKEIERMKKRIPTIKK